MITFATDQTMSLVRKMWKICFGDSDEYMELYFREKYRNENTLVYFDDNQAVASLQILPYTFTFHQTEIPIAYFSGLCTLPDARKKGFMAALIRKAFEVLQQRQIPLAVLVPQEKWLLEFYEKFGFAQTFDAGNKEIFSLRQLWEKYPDNLPAAYREFDNYFRVQDMTVQKTFDDFRAIMDEAKLFDFPPKTNLTGMSRIIDAEKLLTVFARRYPEKTFSFFLSDAEIPKNRANFSFRNGLVEPDHNNQTTKHSLDIRQLSQLLLGYHTSQTEEPFRSLFPEKAPQINFMLE
ncbi:MAG TPA: GNAT family N-acetyltransferase [Dysgonamonadaceae bacterium]|nr:GNAT family N-acetyltransferase [Dysgonamonadaceae bacterium]